MPPSTPHTSRFRNFFTKIKSFLTRRQTLQAAKAARQSGFSPPPTPPPAAQQDRPPRPPGPPTPADAGVPRGPTVEEILAREKRIEELRRIAEEANKERKTLEAPNAAMQPPVRAFGDLEVRKGFKYSTWFKAFGTFGDLRDVGDSPTLLGEMEELEDYDVPRAFYSSSVLGKVKWEGNISRETLIDRLNSAAAWSPNDFRDVYPRWEYRYYVAEMVGDVVVQIFEHKARQPLDKKSKARGFEAN